MVRIEAGDASRFLATMLERVKPKRNEARCALGVPDSEDAALFAQLVVVERVGRQHVRGESISEGLKGCL
jgi:hypothetical protein